MFDSRSQPFCIRFHASAICTSNAERAGIHPTSARTVRAAHFDPQNLRVARHGSRPRTGYARAGTRHQRGRILKRCSLRNQASSVPVGRVTRTAAHCDSVKGARGRILSMFHTAEYEERAPPRLAFRHSLPVRHAAGGRAGTRSTPNEEHQVSVLESETDPTHALALA